MNSILEQVKKRRIALELKQHDMFMRIGVSRQQYQRLESRGNPRLDTLELVAKGLRSELMLIPQEKLTAVLAILADNPTSPTSPMPQSQRIQEDNSSLLDDPWQGLLGDTE